MNKIENQDCYLFKNCSTALLTSPSGVAITFVFKPQGLKDLQEFVPGLDNFSANMSVCAARVAASW